MRRWIAGGYLLLLTYLLITPMPLSPFGDVGHDTEELVDGTLSSYLQHVIAYSVLMGMLWWGFSNRDRFSFRLLVGLAGLHGIVFEGLQYFVPLRHSDWPDLFCNLAGVALGSGLILLAKFFRATCLMNDSRNRHDRIESTNEAPGLSPAPLNNVV